LRYILAIVEGNIGQNETSNILMIIVPLHRAGFTGLTGLPEKNQNRENAAW